MIEQVFAGDRGQAFRRAAGLRAVGRVAIHHQRGDLARQIAGVLHLDQQAVDRALALPVEFFLRILGGAHDIRQHLARRLEIGHRRGQAEEAAVAPGGRAEAGAQTFQTRRDFLRAHVRRPLIGQRGGELGNARLVARIGRGTAGHQHGHGGNRHIAGLRSDHLYPVGQRLLDDLGRDHHRLCARSGRRLPLALGQHGPRFAGGGGQAAEGRHRHRVGIGLRILLACDITHVDPRVGREPFGCDALHIRDGDRRDRLEAVVRRMRVAGGNQRLAQLERASTRGLPAFQCIGEELALRFGEFGCGHRLGPDLLQLGLEQRVDLVRIGGGVDDREARDIAALFGSGIEHRTVDRLPAAHQRIVEAAALAACHDRGEHVERGAIRAARSGRLPDRSCDRQRHVGRGGDQAARLGALGLARGNGQVDRVGAARNVAEILVDQRAQPGHVEIARDDQRGGVGAVIRLVEGARIVERSRVQVLDRADPRPPLRQHVVGVLRKHEPAKAAIGRREHALAQFFLHDIAFGIEHLLVDHRLEHAFAVGPQHGFEIFRRDRLVVIGPVRARGGVARAADIGGEPVDHVVGHVLGLAAENMLEQVRKSAAPFGIVLRPDLVPQRSGDRGGAIVGNRDHAQSVVERPFGKLDLGRGQARLQIGRGILRKGGRGKGKCGGADSKCGFQHDGSPTLNGGA